MRSYCVTRLVVTALFFVTAIGASTTAVAQDTLVALGRVESDGTLSSSRNRVEGVVTAVQNGLGDFTVTVDAAGAFVGAVATDFMVELMVAEGGILDDVAKSSVSVNNDQLSIDVAICDLEGSADGNNAEAEDHAFFFLVRRVPVGVSLVEDGTRFLKALGVVDSSGALLSGYGVDGVSVSSVKNGEGDYTITLSKADGYIGDIVEEHLIFLSPVSGDTLDRVGNGAVISVADNNSVSLSVNTSDVQDAGDDNTVVASDNAFGFAVYQLFGGNAAGIPDSQFLRALANVRGSDGVPLNAVGAQEGMVVNSSRTGAGDYRVTLTDLGAFAGMTANDFVALVTPRQSGVTDQGSNVLVNVLNDNTLHVDVNTNDLEQSGSGSGIASDVDFSLSVYSIDPLVRADLLIGADRAVSRQDGDGVFNSNGGSQSIRLKLNRKRKERFFFTIENEGNVVDDLRLVEIGGGKFLRTKYFNIQSGRVNVSATIKTGGEVASDLRPGKFERFEAQTKYRTLRKRPKRRVRITGSSIHEPANTDTVKVKTVPKRF